jgi:P4 family phage/plasmid primase-like protien
MDTIVPNSDKISQDLASLDNFSQESASLDKLAPESDLTTHPTQRQITREEVEQQLDALGYKAADIVYLRAFFHPTDPRKKDDLGRKEQATSLDQLIKRATRLQNEGRGIYFVVNGGGQKDKDVTTGRAIFYEHDNLDKAAQIEFWKGLGLPEPTFQIDTGGKSIHSYWVFIEPIAIEKWLPLQAELLEFANADRTIKNPSRVMRLAGAWHTSGNQSLIINNSGKRYTFEELRGIIPEAKKPEPKKSKTKQAENTSNKPNSYKDIEVPVPTPVPLECALGKNSKELLDGVGIGRNNSMAALARDLLGVEAEFQTLGQISSDDAYTLFFNACRNCSPGDGWDEKEWNQIWEYAQTKNPTASNSKASPDAVENCIKSWFWQLHKAKDSEKKGKKKDYPAASTTAREIAENYRDKLAWESEYQLWRHYSADWLGCWDIATEESVRELIHCHLETQGWGYNAGYVSSVATILKSKLEVKAWNEQKGLIPLRDGVLNTETQELKPHAPGYRFTYQLPYKWEGRAIGCAPVEEFLLKITGNQAIAEVLLAYLAAVVTGRADAQRYLELIGGGQTGKSTFMALATMLVGEENTVSSQLKLLESNQFETAKFYRKRLILFPDSERWQGEVSILKQLTGQDPIRYERKGVQQCKDFRFEGMIILSANEAPESSDRTSGLERRKLTIALENKLPEYDGRDLKKEFAPYLPGLLKRVLDISPERVFKLIKHTERYVPAVAAKKFEQLTETNPIAAWLDERVVVGADFKAQVGTNNPDYVGKWLYANFCQYQAEMGHKGSLSLSRFKSNLKDLLKNQLKIAISEHRTSTARFINGIALRCLEDPAGNLPRPVTGMATNSDGLELKNDSPVTAETIGSVKSDGHDGFFQKTNPELEIKAPPKNTNSEVEIKAEAQKTEKQMECSGDSTENPSCPSSPAVAPVPIVPDPSPQPSSPPEKPKPLIALVDEMRTAPINGDKVVAKEKQHKELKKGDRVEIVQDGDLYQGYKGKITAIGLGAADTDYYVQLEGFDYECKAIITIPRGADADAYLMKVAW